MINDVHRSTDGVGIVEAMGARTERQNVGGMVDVTMVDGTVVALCHGVRAAPNFSEVAASLEQLRTSPKPWR